MRLLAFSTSIQRIALLPCMHSASGSKVIGVGVHIAIAICTKKSLNRTLAIDSPFQTFAVELLVEFID